MRFRLTRGWWALLALTMVACSSSLDAAIVSPSTLPATPPIGLEVGDRAPDFALRDLKGATTNLSGLRGQPVLVNFWAVWCSFCRIELPEMQKVYESYEGQGFIILAVDVKEETSLVTDLVEDLGLTFPVLLDKQGEVTRSYRIRGLPTSYFIDREGVIIARQLGPIDQSWMERYLGQVGVG